MTGRPDEPRADALRRLRGERSQRAFCQHLVDNGLPAGALSRQRLSRVEQGVQDLPAALWEQIADALVAGGRPAADVAPIRHRAPVAEPAVERVPPSTPELRRRQWSAVAERIPRSRYWRQLGGLLTKLDGTSLVRQYLRLLEANAIDLGERLTEVQRRLALGGGATDPVPPDPRDAVCVDGDPGERYLRVRSRTVFLFRVTLRNAGRVAWHDRFLYRLGPVTASSLPFSVTLLPVPDTDPGGRCELLVPGVAQYFKNLAVMTFVMTRADLTPCVPGRLECFVDTRESGAYDRTFPVPDGLPRPRPGGS